MDCPSISFDWLLSHLGSAWVLLTPVAVAAAWPAAIVLLAWKFEPEIRALFKRAVELKLLGGSVTLIDEARAVDQVEQGSVIEPGKPQIIQFHPLFTPADEITESSLSKVFGDNIEQKYSNLKRWYSQIFWSFLCERNYRTIFGSQIACLNFLNINPAGASGDYLRPFYDEAIKIWIREYEGYTFDRWMGFLIKIELVEERDSKYYITMQGRGFLTYLTENGIAPTKPL